MGLWPKVKSPIKVKLLKSWGDSSLKSNLTAQIESVYSITIVEPKMSPHAMDVTKFLVRLMASRRGSSELIRTHSAHTKPKPLTEGAEMLQRYAYASVCLMPFCAIGGCGAYTFVLLVLEFSEVQILCYWSEAFFVPNAWRDTFVPLVVVARVLW